MVKVMAKEMDKAKDKAKEAKEVVEAVVRVKGGDMVFKVLMSKYSSENKI